MELQDVVSGVSQQNNYRIVQRMEHLIQTNPRYRNLSGANRDLILNLIKKYQETIRRGQKPSYTTIKEDRYHLYENRIHLGLTETDLDQIFSLLESFKD
jgi:hypothetical protein